MGGQKPGGIRHYTRRDPSAVYRLFDADGALLYVGTSYEPKKRITLHRRIKPWRREIATWTIEWFSDRDLSECAETTAIEAEAPKHNVMDTPRHRAQCLDAATRRRDFSEATRERIRQIIAVETATQKLS